MGKSKAIISEFRQKDMQALLIEKNKRLEEIVKEKSSLAASGKKNSKSVKLFKREIAVIETIINEKLATHKG